MKKKLLCILLCAVMLFSAVACGEDETPPVDSSSESSSNSSTPGYTEPADTYTPWDTEGYHIYVSVNGLDTNDGRTKETAVESIHRANELAKSYVDRSTEDSEDVIIALEGGKYYITETITAVSGNENVNVYYTSYGDTKAELIGAHKVDASDIKLCTDEAILSRIDSTDVRANLYEVDLDKYSDVMISIQALMNATKMLPSGTVTKHYDATLFFTDSMVLEPSRWPKSDEGYSNSFNMDIKGYMLTEYINYNKNGEFKTPTEIETDGGASDLPMNIFVSDVVYDKLTSWDIENSEIYTQDFFSNDWDDNIHRVTGFTDYYGKNDSRIYPDPSRGELGFKGYFTTDYGRKYNSEMSGHDDYGRNLFRRYFFFNVLEEIVINGEYYFDDANDKLYVYRTGELANENIYVATLDECMLYIGNSENVSFINIGFKRSQTSIAEISSSNNILFDGCDIGENNGHGMYIYDTTNLTVKNTKIYETGFNAIMINYCSPQTTEALVDANILFDNCVIRDMGRVHYSYASAITPKYSTGITIRNCTIKGGPSCAINWEAISNFTVENCDISDFITDTDDTGLFYDYGNIGTQVGIIFRNNAVHDIGNTWQVHSINIWYQDSYSSGYTIYHNVIYNLGAGDDWIGNIPGTVFTKMKAGLVYDNIVFRTSPDFVIGYPHTPTRSTAGVADLITDDNAKWFCDVHSPETQYGNAHANSIYNVGFENWTVASDDRRDHSYNKLTELRSEEFFDKIMRGTVLIRKGVNIWDKNATFFLDDFARYTDEYGKNQGLEYLTIKYKKAAGGKAKGYVAKYGTDFSSLDEFYELLYYDFGINMVRNGGTSISSSTCEIEYKGTEIGSIYTSIYSLVTPDDPDTPEYDAVYTLSKGISLSQYNTDVTEVGDPDLFKKNNHGTWGYPHIVAAMYTNVFYLAEYDNNLTVGLGFTFSTNKDIWRNDCYKVTNSYDGTAVEFLMLDENKNYTQEFLIYFNNAVDNGKIKGFELLDMSKVGSTLA